MTESRSLKKRVAIFGTFDVANYGDLLFPFIARHELEQRLGPIELVPFSYHAESAGHWPLEVSPLEAFFGQVETFDAVIIGGGHLIRFDKNVAPGYFPALESIHHPTGYWLTPALAAISSGVPVLWNAPSASAETPQWARQLLRLALEQSDYVSVRDENSVRALRKVTSSAAIELVPDTVLGLKSLYDASEFNQFVFNLPKPYLVVQAVEHIDALIAAVREHPALAKFNLVEVPVGPVLGDKVGHLGKSPRELGVAQWKHPLEIAALIAGSEGVVARSLHCSVTGLVFGKPVLTPDLPPESKYSFLGESQRVFAGQDSETLARFADAGTVAEPDPFVIKSLARLVAHWDRIADGIRHGRESAKPHPALHAATFELPAQLEQAASYEQKLQAADARAQLQHAEHQQEKSIWRAQLSRQIAELAERDLQLAKARQELAGANVRAEESAARADEQRARIGAQMDHAQAELGSLKNQITALKNQLSDAEIRLKGLREHDELAFQRIEQLGHSRVWGLLSKVRHAQSLIFRSAEERKQEKLIRESGLFDEAWYLKENPDVALRGVDAAHHYLAWGAAEGRDPGPRFHSAHYLRAYPDVARSGMHPLIHYLIWGKAEGRAPTAAGPLLTAVQ